MTQKTITVNTPLGVALITGNDKGISKVSISKTSDVELSNSDTIPQHFQETVSQLDAYFEGKRASFDLQITPEGTDFQQKVWKELTKIPFGETRSYMDIAKKLGNPKAIRAVAAANGKNPLWIIIPCHRVIGSDGSLTGYAGGLWRKKWLLEHESPVKQQSLF